MSDGGLRKRRSPDPSLPRTTVRDTSISFRALGALLWIMDKPDGWSIRADHMAKDGKRTDGTGAGGRKHRREGREAIRTALLRELAAEGFYRLERRRMLDGSITMGTAASEDRVDSWVAQYEVFGRKPVPMTQQPDGTFLVQYPDGSTGPDDCDPPEVDESDHDDPDPEETAGHTGAQKPVSGTSPVPRNPAPVKPASGEPASGNTSPSTYKEVKGFKERENSPIPPRDDTTTPEGVAAATREGEISDEEEQILVRGLERALRLRPKWSRAAVKSAMTRAVSREGRPTRDVANAIVKAAEDPSTKIPGRILNDLWWIDNVISVEAKPKAACPNRDHAAYSASNCAGCKVDAQQEQLDRLRAKREAEELAAAVREAERAVAAESAGNADEAVVPQQGRRAPSRRPGRPAGRVRV